LSTVYLSQYNVRTYKSRLSPVLRYRSKTQTLLPLDQLTVYCWKKRLTQNIRSCTWERRTRYNQELYKLYWSWAIATTATAAGLWWTGQLQRIRNNYTP